MRYLLLLSILMLFTASTYAQNGTKEIRLTRIFSELAEEQNSLVIQIFSDGRIEMDFPMAHKLYGKKHKLTSKTSNNTFFSQLDKRWNHKDMLKRIEVQKNRNPGTGFYVSDPEILILELLENDTVLWDLTFNNSRWFQKQSKNIPANLEVLNFINSIEDIAINFVNAKLSKVEK